MYRPAILLSSVHLLTNCPLFNWRKGKTLTHQVVHPPELAHVNSLERSLDETASEEVNSLRSVLSVADIGSLNGLHLGNRFEHWCSEVCARGETNGYDCAFRTDVL